MSYICEDCKNNNSEISAKIIKDIIEIETSSSSDKNII